MKYSFSSQDTGLRITADKRLRCFAPSPKLPSATSFIRKPLSEIGRSKVEENIFKVRSDLL
jgi:hypothetical protein